MTGYVKMDYLGRRRYLVSGGSRSDDVDMYWKKRSLFGTNDVTGMETSQFTIDVPLSGPSGSLDDTSLHPDEEELGSVLNVEDGSGASSNTFYSSIMVSGLIVVISAYVMSMRGVAA